LATTSGRIKQTSGKTGSLTAGAFVVGKRPEPVYSAKITLPTTPGNRQADAYFTPGTGGGELQERREIEDWIFHGLFGI
jgi:hypothetical protein